MSPKELEFFYHTIERVAEEAYRKGTEDTKAKKEPESNFKLSRANKLVIKTEINKLSKTH
jgi:hypothetical protein